MLGDPGELGRAASGMGDGAGGAGTAAAAAAGEPSSWEDVGDVGLLQVSPAVRRKLLEAGFRLRRDLRGVGPAMLSKAAGITNPEALEVLRAAFAGFEGKGGDGPGQTARMFGSGPYVLGGATALELHRQESARRRIMTFAAELDGLLGGGVPTGEVTEFCGVPGIGKTQVGMQLSVDVQIPHAFGGLGGEAVYVDTEGSFSGVRVASMAKEAVRHLRKIAGRSNDERVSEAAQAFGIKQIMDKIYVYRLHDVAEVVAFVNRLPRLLGENPRIRLVVIDSVTFHFRYGFDDMRQRTRMLSQLAATLNEAASSHQVAIVLVNQVTTRFGSDREGRDDGGEGRIVPALGETWAHASTNRIMLFWRDGVRQAHLFKSTSLRNDTVPFKVTAEGIRSVHHGTAASGKRPREESENFPAGR